MKKARFLTALLLALALTGCSAQPDPAQPSATEAPAVQETEALTEAPAETEAVTETPEEAAYRFIRDELVPKYGLAEPNAVFAQRKLTDDGFSEWQQLPDSVQGIHSAVLRDFNGDGTLEMVIVRIEGMKLICEVYVLVGDTYTLRGSLPTTYRETNLDFAPGIFLQDDLLVLQNTFAYQESPDLAHDRLYRAPKDVYEIDELWTSFEAQRLTEDDSYISVFFSYDRDEGVDKMYYNFDHGDTIDLDPHETAAEDIVPLVEQKLQAAGVRYDSVDYHQAEKPAGFKRLDITLTDAEPVWEIRNVEGTDQQWFQDHTHLYEKLTGESAAEAPTAAPTEAADPQDIAYRFIRDELIPQEGLSDLQPYLAIDWEMASPTCGELVPPQSTQGIISAAVEDFSGDGVPELLTVVSRGYRIDLDFYTIADDTCLMIGSYSIESSQSVDITPEISIKNGKVIVEYSSLALPGCSSYGNAFIALSTTDGGINTLCELSGFRVPGSVSLNVNGSVQLNYSDTENTDPQPDIEQAAMQCLQDAGLDPVSVQAGWSEDMDLSYGIYPQIEGKTKLFDTTSDEESNVRFNDYTGLREKLG